MKKFSQLTPKAKKITVITSAAAVCVCALSVILYQNSAGNIPAKAADTTLSSATTTEAPVSVAPITGTTTVSMPSGVAGTGSAWVPSSGKSVSAPLTVTPPPASTPPKPSIQGDSKNGRQPTNGALTDKTKKPTYTAPPKAPTAPASKAPTTNKGSGDNDPIFGNNRGTGHGEGTTVSGDWGGGSQVGIMD